MIKQLIVLLSLFSWMSSGMAKTLVQGNAVYYHGQSLEVRKYLDLFTFEAAVIARTDLPKDGSFRIELDINETGLYLIKIGKVHAHIYLEPDNEYTLVIPEPLEADRYNPAKDVFVLPEIFESKSKLNYHITSIEKTINQFLIDNSKFYGRSVNRGILPLADSLVVLLNAQYGNHENAFLRKHLHFRLAMLEIQTNHSRNKVYQKYFEGVEPSYRHLSFAQAFSLFYAEYLDYLNPKHEFRFIEKVEDALETTDFDMLYQALDVDPFLSQRSYKELMLANQLYELGSEQQYARKNILVLLDSLIMTAQDQECKVVAANAEQILTRLAPGTLAPDFQFSDLFGNIYRLSEYRGRYIYIQFFDDFDAETVKEMSLMKVLKEGYGTDIAMFSISTSESLAKLRDISNEYDFRWYFGKAMSSEKIMESYELRALPTYFYLDKKLQFIVSPAPSPGGKIERMFAKVWNEEHPNKELLFKLQPPEISEEPVPEK